MRRAQVLVVGMTIATLLAGRVEAEPSSAELLDRLQAASQSDSGLVRHALHWTAVRGEAKTREYRTEIFRHGLRAGLVVLERRGGGWRVRQSIVSDGESVVYQDDAEVVGVQPGPIVVQQAIDAWSEARAGLSREFPRMPRRSLVHRFKMQLAAGEIDFGVSLRFSRESSGIEFAWLSDQYWRQFSEARLDGGLVRAVGGQLVAVFDAKTGLPVEYVSKGLPGSRIVRARAVEPAWDAGMWQSHVTRSKSGVSADDLASARRHRALSTGMYEQLSSDVVESIPESERDMAIVSSLIPALVTPLVLQRGPGSPFAEKTAATEAERLKFEAVDIGSILCERALLAGWPRRVAFMLGMAARGYALMKFKDR